MNDDLTLLASAYLDGEATPAERSRVEGDELLLVEVERLRTARTALLDASGFHRSDAAVREAAIAAALDAWNGTVVDGSRAGSRPPERKSSVLPFTRRFASTRWLTAAAALVAVGALGVVITQTGESGDEGGSVAVDAPDSTNASAESGTALTERLAPPGSSADALLSADVAADEAGGADPDASAPAEVPTAAAAETGAPADTAAASNSIASDSAVAPVANLETLDDLAAFGVVATQDFDSAQGRDVPVPSCAAEVSAAIEYVVTGTYRGRQVVIGIDDDHVSAIDPNSCEIVAEASLP